MHTQGLSSLGLVKKLLIVYIYICIHFWKDIEQMDDLFSLKSKNN